MGIFFFLVLVLVIVIVTYSAGRRESTSIQRMEPTEKEILPQFTTSVSMGGRPAIEGTPSTSQQCWVPPGTAAALAGRAIGNGFVYVGENLPSVSEWGGVEPALIDPTLPRSDRPDRAGEGMSYWPAYSTIPPGSRSAYLEWLADGRSDPDTYIGYVFLYYYGLERRVLHDAKSIPAAKEEIPLIESEIRRLLSIYGENRSFAGYAGQLLEYLTVTAEGWQLADAPPLQETFGRWFGIGFQVGVGHLALHGQPLSPEWALAWAKQDPNIRSRTPARRCREEFDELFLILYRRKFGEGFKIKPCKRTVAAVYRPASASFDGNFSSGTPYPAVTRLVGPRRKVAEIVDACCDALDPFSRWLGRNPDGRGTLLSASLLPAELIETRAPRAFYEMRNELRRQVGEKTLTVLPARTVFRHWFTGEKEKLTKKETVEAAHLFGHAGFAFEPDVRFSGPRISCKDKIVLFPISDTDHRAPSSDYSAAAILLHLASLVAVVDGQVSGDERQHLRDHLADSLQLSDIEKTRLAAHLEWLLVQPPSTPGGKKRLERLPPDQRRSVGEFLIAVAWADGRVEPEEVNILTRIFRLLGLDPGSVHQWLHSHHASPDLGPVSVAAGGDQVRGYELPPPQSDTDATDDRAKVRLDLAAIAAKLKESERAAATLASIFIDPDETSFEGAPVASEKSPVEGLDSVYFQLLRQLAEQESWARTEYDELADSLGLLPDGALELLNEAAIETCDERLFEGNDPIEINAQVAQEMITWP